MRSTVRAFCLFIFVFAAHCVLGAQTKKPAAHPPADAPEKAGPLEGSRKVMTAPRQVVQFWQIENDLARALAKKDQAGLEKMLSDDFKVWMPNQTGSAIAGDDWVKSGMENPVPVLLRNMSAQEYPEIMLVKFLGQGKSPAGKGVASQYFVVDVWT